MLQLALIHVDFSSILSALHHLWQVLSSTGGSISG